jgi:hypothetical protein
VHCGFKLKLKGDMVWATVLTAGHPALHRSLALRVTVTVGPKQLFGSPESPCMALVQPPQKELSLVQASAISSAGKQATSQWSPSRKVGFAPHPYTSYRIFYF